MNRRIFDSTPSVFKRALLAALAFGLAAAPLQAVGVRVKDLVTVAGARDNQLVGYGLVVGLAETGDKNPTYTVQTLANLLQRHRLTVPPATLSAKNVAAVMVTADIPPFVKPGARIDVTVSSLGDAKSLQGGVLLQTPLLGADDKPYAVAQGALLVGGFSAGPAGGGGANITKNHPTVAQIVNGALVEREIPATIVHDNSLELLLREADFTSAARIADAINAHFPDSAIAIDASSIRVRIPPGHSAAPVDFIARLESIEVNPDSPARIIINEKTGTIIANARIKITSCAISHGNLLINIASTLDVSQPNALSRTGQTVVTPRTDTAVTEETSALVAIPELPTVEQVAHTLNRLGVSPRDLMSIFQAMKQAGALQAELVIR